MANAAGARAEIALRVRHRDHWPRTAYCYDQDEVRRTTGRKLLLEVPAGEIVVAAEYKAVDEGPLDLNDLQYEVNASAVADELPALAVQFTHPEMRPAQPWAFRLWPLNQAGETIAPIELTEQLYVQLLYILRSGLTFGGDIGSSSDVARFAPWEHLGRLDSRWPDADVWPKVQRWNGQRRRRLVDSTKLAVAQRFILSLGRPLGDLRPNATIVTLPDRRPTIGAIRRRRAAAIRGPTELEWSSEVNDRYDRLKWKLNREYKELWANEPASADSREMWGTK